MGEKEKKKKRPQTEKKPLQNGFGVVGNDLENTMVCVVFKSET
jgi:hypothetical protein